MSVTPGTTPGEVVIGVDGSPQSRQALRWGAHLALTYGAPITVVTAWEFPVTYGYGSPLPDWNPADDMRQVQDDAIAGVFGDDPPKDLGRVLQAGNAAHVLLEASEGSLMLVVGSRGHGGFTGLLLGSVSAVVAEHARCPVLIVHGDHTPPEVAGSAAATAAESG
jgi:nucleotide-binding universal stress UspA family protein